MTVARWIIAVAGLAFVLPVQTLDRALGASGGTETILYRFPGVRDNGGGTFSGMATLFDCTNFSGVLETIRIVVRDQSTGVVANTTANISHLANLGFSTHLAVISGVFNLNTGAILGGTAAIAATSTSIVCTAMIVDAASASPVGIALHGIRFSPIPGSEE